jgi:hypothetical protein
MHLPSRSAAQMNRARDLIAARDALQSLAMNRAAELAAARDALQSLAMAMRRVAEEDEGLIMAAMDEFSRTKVAITPKPTRKRRSKHALKLYRYQATKGEPEFGVRGGSFFATDPKLADAYNTAKHNLNRDASPMGGPNLVKRVAVPKNPLKLDIGKDDMLGPSAAQHFLGKGWTDKFVERLDKADGGDYAERFLQKLGVNADEAARLVRGALKYCNATPIVDRIAAEFARKKGHDAIQSEHDFFALDPKATTAYKDPRELDISGRACSALMRRTGRTKAEIKAAIDRWAETGILDPEIADALPSSSEPPV